MITYNGYQIQYEPQKNIITIGLPQTFNTPSCSALPVKDRKEICDSELGAILMIIEKLLEK